MSYTVKVLDVNGGGWTFTFGHRRHLSRGADRLDAVLPVVCLPLMAAAAQSRIIKGGCVSRSAANPRKSGHAGVR